MFDKIQCINHVLCLLKSLLLHNSQLLCDKLPLASFLHLRQQVIL